MLSQLLFFHFAAAPCVVLESPNIFHFVTSPNKASTWITDARRLRPTDRIPRCIPMRRAGKYIHTIMIMICKWYIHPTALQILYEFALENVPLHAKRSHSLVPAAAPEEQPIHRHTEGSHADWPVCCGEFRGVFVFAQMLIRVPPSAVSFALHHCHHDLWHLLLCDGRPRIHTLWLLYYIVRICLCWKQARYIYVPLSVQELRKSSFILQSATCWSCSPSSRLLWPWWTSWPASCCAWPCVR